MAVNFNALRPTSPPTQPAQQPQAPPAAPSFDALRPTFTPTAEPTPEMMRATSTLDELRPQAGMTPAPVLAQQLPSYGFSAMNKSGQFGFWQKLNGLMDIGMVEIDKMFADEKGKAEISNIQQKEWQSFKAGGYFRGGVGAAMPYIVAADQLYSPGSLHLNKMLAREPGWEGVYGQFMLDHPTANAVTAFLDQLLNPENFLLGPIGKFEGIVPLATRMGGRALSAALHTSPMVGRLADGVVTTYANRVTIPLRKAFDRYFPMRADAGPEGERLARSYDTRLGYAQQTVERIVYEKVFGDLDLPQQQELFHRVESGGITHDPNILEPTTGLSFERRRQYYNTLRAWIEGLSKRTDPELLPEDRLIKDVPFIAHPPLDPVDPKKPVDISRNRYGDNPGIAVRKGTLGKHRRFPTMLDRMRDAPDSMPKEWVPAKEVAAWAAGRMRNIIATQFFQAGEKLGLQVPKHYFYERPNGTILHFGGPNAVGKESHDAAQRYASEHGTLVAHVKALQQLGLTNVAAQTRSLSVYKGKLKLLARVNTAMQSLLTSSIKKRNLDRQLMTLSRDQRQAIAGGVIKGAHRNVELNTKRLAYFAKRSQDILAQYLQVQVDNFERSKYLEIFNREKSIAEKQMMEAIDADVAEHYAKQGLSEAGESLRTGIPGTKYSALKPSLAEYMVESGASHKEADALSGWMDRILMYARIGIISNPIIHVMWNQLHAYLAAGGDLNVFNPLNKGGVWSPISRTWFRRGVDAGLFSNMRSNRSLMLGANIAKIMTVPVSKLNPLEQIDWAMTKGWQANQHFVFDMMDHRLSMDLFRKFIRLGYSDGEAARAARKALGDYLNITPWEKRRQLNRVFFFYPWMKTVVPFWTKMGVQKPQYWNAPSAAIRDYNQQYGYNIPGSGLEESNPFALHVAGDPNALTLPFPERYFGWAAQVALGDDYGSNRLIAHTSKGTYGLLGHLNPFLATGASAFATLVSDPAMPGEKPYIMFDKRQSFGRNARDVGAAIGGSFLAPLSRLGLLSGESGVGPMGKDAKMEAILSWVPGGFIKKGYDPVWAGYFRTAERQLAELHTYYGHNPQIQGQIDDLLDRLRVGDKLAAYKAHLLFQLANPRSLGVSTPSIAP
jgi:hypothetical protein